MADPTKIFAHLRERDGVQLEPRLANSLDRRSIGLERIEQMDRVLKHIVG